MSWTNLNSKKLSFPGGCCSCRGISTVSLAIEDISFSSNGAMAFKYNAQVPLCSTCHDLYLKKSRLARNVFRAFKVASPLLGAIMLYLMTIDDKSISGIGNVAFVLILGPVFGFLVGGMMIGNGVSEAILAMARPAKFKEGRLKFRNPAYQAEFDKLNAK